MNGTLLMYMTFTANAYISVQLSAFCSTETILRDMTNMHPYKYAYCSMHWSLLYSSSLLSCHTVYDN